MLRKRNQTQTFICMTPFMCSPRSGKTNLWGRKSEQGLLLGQGGLAGKDHRGAFWGDGKFYGFHSVNIERLVHLKSLSFIVCKLHQKMGKEPAKVLHFSPGSWRPGKQPVILTIGPLRSFCAGQKDRSFSSDGEERAGDGLRWSQDKLERISQK